MTIHLIQNTDDGDIRIKDGLARKIDINPCSYMTRKGFISHIVRVLLLEGNGNCVVYPKFRNGLLDDLIPLNPSGVSFLPNGESYLIRYLGKQYQPDEVLHFVLNPDPEYPWKGEGYQHVLKTVAHSLKQATETKNGFMKSKWKPSLIVKVDGMVEEFASKEGRQKLLEQYIQAGEAGEPWLIPAEQFDVVTVKPLSLTDLALNDAVSLDKHTIASILDVPPYLVGAGDYNKEEYNNFIHTRILSIAKTIEQELTKKLLLASDRYFRFNSRALYTYNLTELATVGESLYTRGLMLGNEVRDWLDMTPLEGLSERIILENYIPADMIGKQKKLNEIGGEKAETTE